MDRKHKRVILHPPILCVSDVTQTTANLVWTPSSNGAASVAFCYKIRYWRNGQRSSVHVFVDSGENQFRLEDLQPGSTYSINIVATSEDGQESAPSHDIEFITLQLQKMSSSVGIAPCTSSTMVDELKLIKELISNLSKESDEAKLALIKTVNRLEDKIKESTRCLTKRLQEKEKTILALNKKLNETSTESLKKWMETSCSSVINRFKTIAGAKPLIQDEAKTASTLTAIEKKWFNTIKFTYDVQAIENLILNGIDVNAKDYEGQTALHVLCKKHRQETRQATVIVDLVQLLIENGVDVNAKDNNGQTPLHVVCEFNQNKNLIDIVRLLIENGVDVNAKDNRGRPAFYLMCMVYNNDDLIDIVHLFLENGTDVSAKNNNGYSALNCVRICMDKDNQFDTVRLLVRLKTGEHGVDDIVGRYMTDRKI